MTSRQQQIELLLAASRDAFWRGFPSGTISVAQATDFVEQVDRPRLNLLSDDELNELASDPDFLADVDAWSDLNLRKFQTATARPAGLKSKEKSNGHREQ